MNHVNVYGVRWDMSQVYQVSQRLSPLGEGLSQFL